MQKKRFIHAIIGTMLITLNPVFANENHSKDDFEEICVTAANEIAGDYSEENQSEWQTTFDSCISKDTDSYNNTEDEIMYEEDTSIEYDEENPSESDY